MILSVVVVNVVISSVVVVVVVVLVAVQYDAQIIKRYENFISPLSILISSDIRLIWKSRGGNYENTTNVEDKEKHDYFTREVYYRNRGLWTRVHILSNWFQIPILIPYAINSGTKFVSFKFVIWVINI